MPQFSVHRNPNPDTRAAYPLLLDVQSDLIAGLRTRVVVPKQVGAKVADLAQRRDEIIAALDLLITGM